MKHKKRFYIKAVNLPSHKSPHQERFEKVIEITQKTLHTALWKFLKLFEDTSARR